MMITDNITCKLKWIKSIVKEITKLTFIYKMRLSWLTYSSHWKKYFSLTEKSQILHLQFWDRSLDAKTRNTGVAKFELKNSGKTLPEKIKKLFFLSKHFCITYFLTKKNTIFQSPRFSRKTSFWILKTCTRAQPTGAIVFYLNFMSNYFFRK